MIVPGWDQTTAEKARQGLPGAYAQLVHRYSAPIRHSVLRIVGDREHAQDITQQAFLSAYEHLAEFDARHRFFSWVYRIAVNEALNASRLRWRRCPLESIDLPTPGPSPEENLMAREQLEGMRDALRGLPAKYRIVLDLRYDRDLSYAEIARTLSLPATTVKSRLHTARRLLRREWERRENGSTWARIPGPPSRRPGRCAPVP